MSGDDIRYVTALVKAAGTSFYYGMKILPPERRDAMYGIYAFCRVVDDIADEAGTLAEKRIALDDWRTRIAALFTGATSDPITRALAPAVAAYGLVQQDFLDIIDGMEMDAGDPIVAPDLATLDLYCDRVAAAVGRLSVRIFGDSSDTAQQVAHALGRALQLTNILRDVREDSERGRLYLPQEFLVEAGIPTHPKAVLTAPELPIVCARLATMAEQNFMRAEAAMDACNQRAMRPARLMAASYRPLLTILRKRNFAVTAPRATLPRWRKLALSTRLLLA